MPVVSGRVSPMVLPSLLADYREEIADQICPTCAARAAEGPLCPEHRAVEAELPALAEAVHQAYAAGNGRGPLHIGSRSRLAPPLEALVIQAIETVDERWASP